MDRLQIKLQLGRQPRRNTVEMPNCSSNPPLNFIRTLGDKEALGVRLDLGSSGIYRYFAVHSLLHAFYFDGQQEQFQFRETQPNCSSHGWGSK